MSVVGRDTMTEGSNTALTAHTPDVGSGWNQAKSGSAILVVGGAGYARDNFDGDHDNAHVLQNDLGVVEYDVSGTFTHIGGSSFFGVLGRLTSNGFVPANYMQYARVNAFGVGWEITDKTTSSSLNESTSYPVDMKMTVRNNSMKGYVGGVEKVSLAVNPNASTGKFVGIVLGHFDGSGTDNSRCDVWEVDDLAAAATVTQSAYRFYADDDVEGAATPLANENAPATIAQDTAFRVRVLLAVDGALNRAPKYKLQARRVGTTVLEDVGRKP